MAGETWCKICKRYKNEAIQEQLSKGEQCGLTGCVFQQEINLALLQPVISTRRETWCKICKRYKNEAIQEQLSKGEQCGLTGCVFQQEINLALLQSGTNTRPEPYANITRPIRIQPIHPEHRPYRIEPHIQTTQTRQGWLTPGKIIIVSIVLIAAGIFFWLANIPSMPQNLRHDPPGADSVIIRWDNAGKDISYQVYISRQNDPSSASPLGDPKTTTSTNVTNMSSDTNYYFWVTSVKGKRESNKSSVLTVKTVVPAPPPPQNTSFDQARTITSGATADATLQADISHYYRTQVGAGTLTAYTTGNTDTMMWLYDSNRRQLAENDDTSNTDRNARVSMTVSAGTYFIRVGGYGSNYGAYTLHVSLQSTQTATQNQNTSFDQARTITSGTTVNDTLQANVSHYYRVQVGAGTLTAYTTGNTDTMIWLYNANRNELVYNDDTSDSNRNARISSTVSAGTYFIRVGGYGSNYGAYTLHVSLQPTQTSSPSQYPLNETTWEYINQNDSGNRYRLSFSGSSSVKWEIYSSNGSGQPLESHNGSYTLQGNNLSVTIEGERYYYTYTQTTIVDKQKQSIVYRKR